MYDLSQISSVVDFPGSGTRTCTSHIYNNRLETSPNRLRLALNISYRMLRLPTSPGLKYLLPLTARSYPIIKAPYFLEIIIMFCLLRQEEIISIRLNMAKSCFSTKWDSTANTLVKLHFSTRRSKLEDSSPSLFLVSEWFQEPYEIELWKKSWSRITLNKWTM